MQRAALYLVFIGILAASAAADDTPSDDRDELPEAEGSWIVGDIALDKADVFDLSNPDEDRWLYRAANRFHIVSRDSTIRKQLLFQSGDTYDKRVIEESERILRRNKYLYDAKITATRVADGTVDLVVATRDVWSLAPELSVSRSGGETRSRIGIEESNLLGRGQLLRVLRDNDIERNENIIEFGDRNLGRTWVSLTARYSDNSDGDSSLLAVTRPFYALDSRWAAGGTLFDDDRRSTLYQFGEAAAEYRHEREYAHAFGGWSQGIRNGRVWRWTTGVVYDDNRFSDSPSTSLPSVVPADRKLVYPYLGVELIEDGYVTTRNRDQIERTEDFQMGLQVRASLGWADESFGADRNAGVFAASASRGFGSLEDTALLLSAASDGRLESGDLTNAKVSVDARYYRRQSEKRTFFIGISGTRGTRLDLDNPVELGGKTGMRGYPLRYQAGESKALATIEQRYYTDWYPFRFARVGGAIFADVGQVWGANPLGEDNRGWISDVGFGLRLALTRVSDRVVHIDVAFPLNDDPTIDNVQFLIESRKSF
jgi:outer membrane protein assembly factor BamA